MFKCTDITITLQNDNVIIKGLSLILNDGDKLALIGEEGNGKSTLLKFLYDPHLIDAYAHGSGTTNLTRSDIAYLPQTLDKAWEDFSIMDFFLHQDIDSEIDYDIYNHLFDIEKLLQKFSLDVALLTSDRKIKTLSGGEKIKLQLVKLLLTPKKLILLDEPTNDLDIDTLNLFESIIKRIDTPIIFISHDEVLLRNVSNQILHLEQIKRQKLAKHNYYKQGYKAYIEERGRTIEKHNREAVRSQKEYLRRKEILLHQHLLVENDLDRASGNQPSQGRILAKKMRNIKSQEKKLENMEVVERYKVEEAMNLFFDDNVILPNGKVVLDFYLEALRIENKTISSNVVLKIVGPEKVVIYGSNGSGKTTLIKELLKHFNENSSLSIGYMPQNYSDVFDETLNPVSYLQTKLGYDVEIKTKIMTFLGSLNFMESEMVNPISALSSGLKAKLYLLELVLGKYEVLILDEPTRNLSPLSSPVVRKMLSEFKGALIMVSHDRALIEEVATVTYALTQDGLIQTHIFLNNVEK